MKIEHATAHVEHWRLIPEDTDKNGVGFVINVTINYDSNTLTIDNGGFISLSMITDCEDDKLASLTLDQYLSALSTKRIFDIEQSKIATINKIRGIASSLNVEEMEKIFVNIDSIDTFADSQFIRLVQKYLYQQSLKMNGCIKVIYRYPTIEEKMITVFYEKLLPVLAKRMQNESLLREDGAL